jgi:hypothetical protein
MILVAPFCFPKSTSPNVRAIFESYNAPRNPPWRKYRYTNVPKMTVTSAGTITSKPGMALYSMLLQKSDLCGVWFRRDRPNVGGLRSAACAYSVARLTAGPESLALFCPALADKSWIVCVPGTAGSATRAGLKNRFGPFAGVRLPMGALQSPRSITTLQRHLRAGHRPARLSRSRRWALSGAARRRRRHARAGGPPSGSAWRGRGRPAGLRGWRSRGPGSFRRTGCGCRRGTGGR